MTSLLPCHRIRKHHAPGRYDTGGCNHPLNVLKTAEIISLTDRLLLAAVFLLAGATKLVDPAGTRKALREFGLPLALARPGVVLLPTLEMLLAAALVPAATAWFGAAGVLGLLIVFLVAIGISLARGKQPDCHCFGQLHSEPAGASTLVRNIALAVLAGWLVWLGEGATGPDLWMPLLTLGTLGRKFALAAGLLATLTFLGLVARARPRPATAGDDDASADGESDKQPVRTRPVTRRAPPPAGVPYVPPETGPVEMGPINIGLPEGTLAPPFELPALDGQTVSLQSLLEHGRDVLLIFSRPHCDGCAALAANMPRWIQAAAGVVPEIVIISTGTVEENAKLKDFPPSRVLLQTRFETGAKYDCDTTPAGVLVGADGLIRSELVLGAMSIRQLLSRH